MVHGALLGMALNDPLEHKRGAHATSEKRQDIPSPCCSSVFFASYVRLIPPTQFPPCQNYRFARPRGREADGAVKKKKRTLFPEGSAFTVNLPSSGNCGNTSATKTATGLIQRQQPQPQPAMLQHVVPHKKNEQETAA